ncbi:tRNA pseudouridine(38-40) synthase TruA [Merdimmobilis hominis]|jgi:tRNA pseudouridine38-40 synthase|uniref:tRNA pseudouridine synthase A n=1 Tax=uncultured Anaerotruncus sp. TaxID=905011 RepID=A0A6N2T217_9FIRM|nr:tRNA pseudouridine(38-40) synthase TruA [Merdimmobilis hominis]MCD4836002.1 tRNA pseudouridine(38-40) synthase TruA [Merdimmobilis hominis]PWL62332.1 MAG: tRNA pseudouridine(38-40) synthase TruA [Oscillospiraceae bacterium]
MRNLLLTIRYKGTKYHGFQVQKNALAVATVFQDAVEAVFHQRLDIKGCSRTDTGVHANRFCVSLKTESTIPCDRLVKALNINLPWDVAVLACREVPLDFHARYNCKGKRYVYKILNSEIKDPFLEGLVHQHRYPLDVQELNRAAQDFVGTHDFSSFCSAGSKIEDMTRTIYAASVRREGDLVLFTVEGDGFLYNMVRIMAGTLIDISKGLIPPDGIPAVIAARDRERAGFTAPACGLYLDEVFYEEGEMALPSPESK